MTERRPDRVLGPGHDIFWRHCAAGELHLPRCTRCATLAWPIATACAVCGNDGFAWERLSGRGTIASWCTFERDYYQGRLPIPWETILVALEEGPLFVSNPLGLTWRDMAVDLPVRVVFLECEDGAGTFRLPVFEADPSPPRMRAEPGKDQAPGEAIRPVRH